AGQHLINLAYFELWIVFRRRNNQTVLFQSNSSGDSFRYLGKERMNQVGNDQADQVCATCEQGPRRRIGLIVEFLHALLHSFASRCADVGTIAQYFGNRDNRHAQVPRNVFHRNRHKLIVLSSTIGFYLVSPGEKPPPPANAKAVAGTARAAQHRSYSPDGPILYSTTPCTGRQLPSAPCSGSVLTSPRNWRHPSGLLTKNLSYTAAQHAMASPGKTRLAATLCAFALVFFLFVQPAAATGNRAKIKVLIVDGFSNHDWRQTTALLRGILEPSGLFTVSVS